MTTRLLLDDHGWPLPGPASKFFRETARMFRIPELRTQVSLERGGHRFLGLYQDGALIGILSTIMGDWAPLHIDDAVALFPEVTHRLLNFHGEREPHPSYVMCSVRGMRP